MRAATSVTSRFRFKPTASHSLFSRSSCSLGSISDLGTLLRVRFFPLSAMSVEDSIPTINDR